MLTPKKLNLILVSIRVDAITYMGLISFRVTGMGLRTFLDDCWLCHHSPAAGCSHHCALILYSIPIISVPYSIRFLLIAPTAKGRDSKGGTVIFNINILELAPDYRDRSYLARSAGFEISLSIFIPGKHLITY